MTLRHLSMLCRIAVACVFLLFAVPKVLSPVDFARSIHLYELLPSFGVSLLAVGLPWVELVAAWALLFGRRMVDAAAALLLVLLLVFNAAMLSAMARGLSIDCGCSGAISTPVGWESVFRNLGLALLCGFVLYAEWAAKAGKPRTK